MKVVGYLYHSDLLLEDETGVMIIGGSHYVLSLGDNVYLKHAIDQEKLLYSVDISFASNNHSSLFEDQCMVKFEGCRAELTQHLSTTTVH